MQIDDTELLESHPNIPSPKPTTIFPDLIQQLHRRQHLLKKSIETCDILFLNKQMNTKQKQLCMQQVQKQQNNFGGYMEIFRELDEKHQRPYKNMVKRFKFKVDEHVELLDLIQRNKHTQFIQSKQEIWEEEFQSQSSAKYIFRGIVGIIGAMLLHFLFGGIFRWAMINNYITSFYKLTNDPYIETGQNSIGTPIFMLSAGLTMKTSLNICKKFQDRLHLGKILFLFIVVVLVSIDVFICSYMPSFLYFIFFHNFLYGVLVGCLFLTSLSECQKYFESQKLFVTSLILTGEGFGCVVFGLMNINCVNPQEYSPNNNGYFTGVYDSVAYSVPFCIREMAIYALGIGILGCLLLIPITRYNNNVQVIEYRIRTHKTFQNQCYSEQQALKSPIFYIIGVIIILASAGNFFMTVNYKNIPKDFIHNEKFLALVALSGMIANGFFRFLWGISLQKVGFKWVFLVAMVLNAVSFISMPFAIHYYNLYLVGYTIAGAVSGGLMVLMTNLSLLVFGQVGNQMFGYMWGAFTIANFIQYFMGVILTKIIPHEKLVVVFGVTSLIALVISSLVKYQGRWQNSLNKLQY